MKTLVTLFFAAIFSLGAFAQNYVVMVKSTDSREWGYVNIKGEKVIDPQFTKCNPFSEDGLALVFVPDQNQYAFAKLDGTLVNPEVKQIKSIKSFSDGMAAVRPDKLWGFIDTSGKLVIEAKYSDISEFDGGFATAQSGSKYVVLNKQGKETPVSAPDLKGVKQFSEGLAPFHTNSKLNGFIGTDGNVAIEARFNSVGYFRDGLAWAKDANNMVGYINKKGEWVIEPQFAAGHDFDKSTGLARVKKGEQWGYVNKNGEMLNMNNTDTWGDFSNGLAKGRVNGSIGFFNSSMEYVIDPQFEGVREFKNGYAAAKQGGKWGVIDKKGNWVINPEFDGIRDVERIP